jgi:hypothetical protein
LLEIGEESDAPRPRRVLQEGDYYGGFGAQTVFDPEVPKGALLIEIFRADNTAYSHSSSLRSVFHLGSGCSQSATASGCCLDIPLPCPENRPIMGQSTRHRLL